MPNTHTYRFGLNLDFCKSSKGGVTYRTQSMTYDNNEPQPAFTDLHRDATSAELRDLIKQFRSISEKVYVRVRSKDLYGKPTLKRAEMCFIFKEM